MKCCSRSIAWRVSVLLLAAVLGGRDLSARSDTDADAPVRLALVKAVRLRMGDNAAVRLEQVAFTLSNPAETAGLTATPEPGSRLGRPVRFTLMLPPSNGRPRPRRVGSATAHVFVAVEPARAATAIARGGTLADTDLAIGEWVEQMPVAYLFFGSTPQRMPGALSTGLHGQIELISDGTGLWVNAEKAP